MSTFDWKDFFVLAEELSDRDEEASLRSSISRYYYSVFGCTRVYLIETKGEARFSEKSSGIHSEISNKLENSKDDTEAHLGEILTSLRTKRNEADYDWLENKNFDYFKNELDMIKKKVNDALESIDALNNSPPFEI